jgi:protein-S-isoprenylcysteine O-methyltransferase Ste14
MNQNEHEIPDTPGVLAPPPLIYASALAAGLLANILSPVKFLPDTVARMLGWPLIGAGLVLGILGDRALQNADTNVSPYLPTTKLVTEGPYRFTRNPLYLCLTLVYGGIAALANALWIALLLPIVLVVMRYGVIRREERYLERKFGVEYLRYKAQVRRWI